MPLRGKRPRTAPLPVTNLVAQQTSCSDGGPKPQRKTCDVYEERLLKADPCKGGILLYAQGVAVLQGDSLLVEQYAVISAQLDKVERDQRKVR